MSHDDGDHAECIVLHQRMDWDAGMIVTGMEMPPTATALAWIVDGVRAGKAAPVITAEGDLLRFTLANGTWIYRIGERITIGDDECYRLRWVD